MKSLIILGGLKDVLRMRRALGPSERIAGLVRASEETVEEFLEILLGMLNAVRQTLFAEDAEETLDEVHPRGVRGRVVKVNSRMATQPAPGRLVLVDIQVVHDHVECPIRIGSHDVIHEPEKVHRGAPVTDMSDHFTGGIAPEPAPRRVPAANCSRLLWFSDRG